MEIPFQVGVPVSGRNFIDREEILDELLSSAVGIKKGIRQDFALISPRRMGKTSLLLKLKEKVKEEVTCVYLDCSRLYPFTLVNLLQAYSEGIYSEYSKKARLQISLDAISNAVKGAGTIILDIIQKFGAEFGDMRIWLEFKENRIDETQLLEKVLDLPEDLATRNKSYFLIILDEFQELERFGPDFLKYLRAVMTSQKRVNYVVSGSKVSMMEKIVHEKKSPFYNLFVVKTLGNLPRKDAKRFLENKFKAFGYNANGIDAILDLTDGHPFYLQWLARSAYIRLMPRKCLTIKRVKEAYKAALKEPAGHFEYEIAKIRDRGRYMDILVIMAKFDLRTPSKIGRKLDLKAGEVSPYLKKLIEWGFLKKRDHRYEFVDKILGEWMRVNY